MLSNNSNILLDLQSPNCRQRQRQKQHRRQNSTPTAFEGVKAQNLPNIPRHALHRRGISLDQRRQRTPPQDYKVSITNQGYQTTQQHILRETQQQRLVRPGQQFSFDNDENYLGSPAVTPQRQSFDAGCMSYGEQRPNSQYSSYSGPINTIINVDPNSFNGANDFSLFSADGKLTPSAFLDFSTAGFENTNGSNGNESRRSSRRISGGILNRVAQFENMAMQTTQRPITPPNQNISNYFPPTPMDTPHNRVVKQEHMQQRFHDPYDTSMEETLKPKSSQRARGVFEDMRREAESRSIPSPPRSGPMPSSSTFDSAPMPSANFMNMSNLNMDFLKSEQQFSDAQSSPVSAGPSPALSYHSSPEISQMALLGDPFENKPTLDAPAMSYPDPSPPEAHGLPSSPASHTSHRRSESVSSMLEETITDTGITIDDIANFIKGPDPQDGKWVCLYPECEKRFGRKENIKSHVQTHLGDRQFQCPHCKKCFVRQHDLKRHAKIHSGVKPYPCQCGNSFARHDALTRHRQRGMCIGAFEGVVKKIVKRGRPRKNRPDNEERVKKSSRTRSKNKAMSSTSSTTGYSDSNGGHSPRSDLDILDDKPFADYEYTQSSSAMPSSSFEYSQAQSPAAQDCVSPQAIQNTPSPAAFSTHSHLSHHSSVSEHLPSAPHSPAKSVHSYHSPPGLCQSSSSPAPSNHYYELDGSSYHGDEMVDMGSLANIPEHDDEMFLQAFAASGGADMLMTKLEDTYPGNEDMFKDDGDYLFGSP